MDKALEILSDPRLAALLLAVAGVALFAARIAVGVFKARAATTPDPTDDKIAEAAEQVLDVADAVVGKKKK